MSKPKMSKTQNVESKMSNPKTPKTQNVENYVPKCRIPKCRKSIWKFENCAKNNQEFSQFDGVDPGTDMFAVRLLFSRQARKRLKEMIV